MNNVNKTLYIPLYGKAFVSQKGLFLKDSKAEAIWSKEGFPLKGKSKSKWLAYFMGIRATIFDDWLRLMLAADSKAVVLHIGCGLDSRILRVQSQYQHWYDIDFPEVIAERQKYYSNNDHYQMVAADMRDSDWKEQIPKAEKAYVVLEGISMYFQEDELTSLLSALKEHFKSVRILMDCYTQRSAKASKFKNPINDVGVTTVFGYDHPEKMAQKTGLRFVVEQNMTPKHLVDQLSGFEHFFFKTVFTGQFAKSMYRMYEFEGK